MHVSRFHPDRTAEIRLRKRTARVQRHHRCRLHRRDADVFQQPAGVALGTMIGAAEQMADTMLRLEIEFFPQLSLP
jgi:hypothetical protein